MQLIVAGMHRSGTSLTAAFVDAIGISMGERLLAADRNNQKGYFEDVDFLEFHREVLTKCTSAEEPGVHDWGWTLHETLDREKYGDFRDRACELIQSREEKLSAWGWKDPRTTVMLDFWHDLLPEARFLLVYRAPWDVAESMMRVGGEYFPKNPDHSLAIWSFYNESLLRFYRSHPDRCILFSVGSLIREPMRVMELMRDKLGLQIGDEGAAATFGQVFSGDLFHALPPDHPVVQLVREFHPRSVSVLQELEREADLPGGILPDETPGVDPDRLAAWPFFIYQETAEVKGQLAEARKQLAERDARILELEKRLWEAETDARQHEALAADVKAKAEAWWNEKQTLWEEKQALWSEAQKLSAQNQELWAESQRLQAQVTDLYKLYEQLQTQRAELGAALEAAHRELGEIKWQEQQRRHERDALQVEIDGIRQTRLWKLRERLRRLG